AGVGSSWIPSVLGVHAVDHDTARQGLGSLRCTRIRSRSESSSVVRGSRLTNRCLMPLPILTGHARRVEAPARSPNLPGRAAALGAQVLQVLLGLADQIE